MHDTTSVRNAYRLEVNRIASMHFYQLRNSRPSQWSFFVNQDDMELGVEQAILETIKTF